MLVAKPGRHAVVGQQHHPGILQTAGRQHADARTDPVPEPAQRLQLQMLDMPTPPTAAMFTTFALSSTSIFLDAANSLP